MKDMNLIEKNVLPRSPEGFRDEVSTIENVTGCHSVLDAESRLFCCVPGCPDQVGA